MNEFKESLYELLIEGNDGEINYNHFANNIPNWPEISFYDEDIQDMHYESLGTDNCAIISIDEDCIELVSGNDYQEPHLIKIEFQNSELTVVYFEPHEFIAGMDYDEIEEALQ